MPRRSRQARRFGPPDLSMGTLLSRALGIGICWLAVIAEPSRAGHVLSSTGLIFALGVGVLCMVIEAGWWLWQWGSLTLARIVTLLVALVGTLSALTWVRQYAGMTWTLGVTRWVWIALGALVGVVALVVLPGAPLDPSRGRLGEDQVWRHHAYALLRRRYLWGVEEARRAVDAAVTEAQQAGWSALQMHGAPGVYLAHLPQPAPAQRRYALVQGTCALVVLVLLLALAGVVVWAGQPLLALVFVLPAAATVLAVRPYLKQLRDGAR